MTPCTIQEFIEQYPGAEFGPAHIVLADCNITDDNINWCLGLLRAAISKSRDGLSGEDLDFMKSMDWYKDDDPKEMKATIQFLEWLLVIPYDKR